MKPETENRLRLTRELPEKLLGWYSRSKRALPWRGTPTPYEVWVSEIMLQQTRVETVKDYYRRFLAALPDISALAAAPEEKLLKLWQGLGYYSRVKNLASAARIVRDQFNGELPADFDSLTALPGIGEYTAGAILSIAFGQRFPAVDGNVVRVIARLTGAPGEAQDPALRTAISSALKKIYPAEHAGDFTQSLMELGATVCLPNGAPLCGSCPLYEACFARMHDRAADLPEKPLKRPRGNVDLTVLILTDSEGRVVLRRRAEKGLLAGLWEFPNLTGRLAAAAIAASLGEWPLVLKKITPLDMRRHIFTHLEWTMYPWRIEFTGKGAPDWFHVGADELEKAYPLPSAFGKLLGSLSVRN